MLSKAWSALTSLAPSFGAANPSQQPNTAADAKSSSNSAPPVAAASADEFSLVMASDNTLLTESEHTASEHAKAFHQQRKDERDLELINLDNKYLASTRIALLELAQKRRDELQKIAAEQVANKQIKKAEAQPKFIAAAEDLIYERNEERVEISELGVAQQQIQHFDALAEAEIQAEFDRFAIERGIAQDLPKAYQHLQERRARSEAHAAQEKLNQIYQFANQFRDKIFANANAYFPDNRLIHNFALAIAAVNPKHPHAADKILKQMRMLQEQINFDFKGDQENEEHHSKQRNKILATLEIAKAKLAIVPPKHTLTIKIEKNQPELPRDHMFSRQSAGSDAPRPPATPPLEANDLPPVISHYRRL